MRRLAFCLALTMGATTFVGSAQGVNIVWVTPHVGGPSSGAAGAGFTEPPDIGYTNLLAAAGHSVTRILTQPTGNNAVLPASDLATMNAADLVIMSRSANSGIVDNVNEINSWNTAITKPVIIISGFASRNTRLGMTTGATTADITGPTRLLANVPGHPIFQGVTLNGSNETGTFFDLVTAPTTGNPVQRGAAINNNTLVTGATLLASVTSDSAVAPGGPVIAEFPVGTASSFAGGGNFASKRMLFITGSREVNGVNSDTAGILDLSADGQLIFKNAVCYMAGSCSTIVLGDTDGDGIVEYPEDFDPIRMNFRKSVTTRAQGDLTGDGKVDFADFRQWRLAFVGNGGSLEGVDLSFVGSVPEPGSLSLFLTAIPAFVARTRMRRSPS